MVQVGRRRRQAGRQPVRDRDRQGVDGGAVDHDRRARGNPRRRRRGGAGRRGRRGDRGRGLALRQARSPRAARATPPKAGCAGRATRRLRLAGIACHRAARGNAPAPVALDPFFEVRTPERNYGPARLAGRRVASRRWRGGWPPRPGSISRITRLRPARPRSSRATSRPRRRPRRVRAPRWRGADAPTRSRRSIATGRSRKCRSTACARPSRRGWCRRSRPSRISI